MNEPSPLQTAQRQLSQRRPFDALKIVNRVLKENPGNWSAHICHGKIMEWLGDFKKAHAAFDLAGVNGAATDVVRKSKQRIDTVSKLITDAKVSLKAGNTKQALENLEAARRLRPSQLIELITAQALFADGRAEKAREFVERFLIERPGHNLAKRLKREIDESCDKPPGNGMKLSKPQIAQSKARTARPKPPHNAKPVKPNNLAAEFATKLAGRVAKIEAALSTDIAEVRKHIRWLKNNAEMIDGSNWADDVVMAKAAHFLFAKDTRLAVTNYDAHLIEKSVEFGYITWPRRIQQYIRNGKVLDVGCGFGAFGNGFLVAGATEYVGIDPQMPLDSSSVKNKRKRMKADLGITPREIMRKCPNIRLVNGIFEDLDTSETFDAIALHNVTEHLMQIRDIIPNIRRLLKPDGRLIYHHHNFYCWNGHHMRPHRPESYEPGVAEQDRMVDWNHIVIAPDMPNEHYFNTNLNQIRLDEIKASTSRHYDLEVWREIDSPPSVGERLTDKVLAKLRDFDPTLSKRDLMVNAVFCVAKLK